MIDRIDLLVLATIEWCSGNVRPPIYTKNSIEDCALEIVNCGVDNKGKVLDNAGLHKCSVKGQRYLIRIVYPYAIIQDISTRNLCSSGRIDLEDSST